MEFIAGFACFVFGHLIVFKSIKYLFGSVQLLTMNHFQLNLLLPSLFTLNYNNEVLRKPIK